MCPTEYDRSRLLDSIVLSQGDLTRLRPAGKRIHLHELGSWCCSIIGTCLSHDDLMVLARKWNVKISEGARMFDVHGFFVKEAGRKTDISAGLQKLLDKRYRGFVKRISKITDYEDQVRFWNDSVNDGFVAGAYWALVSHTHVAEDLQSQVFGEVHMMSHLMGGSAQRIVGAAAEIQDRMEQMERQHDRWSAQARQAIERRDTQILKLQNKLDEVRKAQIEVEIRKEPENAKMADRASRLLLKRERALIASRTKNRQLEGEVETLKLQLEQMRARRQNGAAAIDDGSARRPARGLCGKAVLYLGGRASSIVHMRRTAEELEVELLHHDGGLEQSAQLIGELVERCDAVVCPVNCINHQACLKAKRICKRLNKPFMPIASTGQRGFNQALSDLADRIGEPTGGAVLQ
ncbi:MAG: DUF2325 domain-containing protein [Pseudomonadota bacterium]